MKKEKSGKKDDEKRHFLAEVSAKSTDWPIPGIEIFL